MIRVLRSPSQGLPSALKLVTARQVGQELWRAESQGLPSALKLVTEPRRDERYSDLRDRKGCPAP